MKPLISIIVSILCSCASIADVPFDIEVAGASRGMVAQIVGHEQKVYDAVFGKTGELHGTLPPGTYTLLVKPGMMANFSDEIVLCLPLTIEAGRPFRLSAELPSLILRMRLDGLSESRTQMWAKIVGDAVGVHRPVRWAALSFTDGVWIANTPWFGPGKYRIWFYPSTMAAHKDNPMLQSEFVLPKTDKRSMRISITHRVLVSSDE